VEKSLSLSAEVAGAEKYFRGSILPTMVGGVNFSKLGYLFLEIFYFFLVI
jgi:hypothetical protein